MDGRINNYSYNLPKSYKKIGWTFFGLAIIILTFMVYLVWARVTIIISPNTESLNQELIFEIKEADSLSDLADLAEDGSVAGVIRSIPVESSRSFTATGSKTVHSTNIIGEVTLINNYSQEQTLVESTRLAAPEDPETVLARLNKTVVAPAGQKIRVQVYTDSPEDFEKIEPTRFIIPGLWSGLQDKIYAENEKTLSREGNSVSVVTKADLEQAEGKLIEELYQKALAEANKDLGSAESLWPKLVTSKIDELTFDAAAEEEASEFTALMKLNVIVVVFDESELISLARDRVRTLLPAERQLVDLDPGDFSYKIEDYDAEAKRAEVKATIAGSSVLADESELFDKTKLVGLTEEEVKFYFSQFDEVKSVEVIFQPSFLKKTPRIKEKIEIEIAR